MTLNSQTASFLAYAPSWKWAGDFAATSSPEQPGLSVAFAHVCSFLIPIPSMAQGCVTRCHHTPICLLSGRSNGSARVNRLLELWSLAFALSAWLFFALSSGFFILFLSRAPGSASCSMSCSKMTEPWLLCALAGGRERALWAGRVSAALSYLHTCEIPLRSHLLGAWGGLSSLFNLHQRHPFSYQSLFLFLCVPIPLPRIWKKSSSEPVGWLS